MTFVCRSLQSRLKVTFCKAAVKLWCERRHWIYRSAHRLSEGGADHVEARDGHLENFFLAGCQRKTVRVVGLSVGGITAQRLIKESHGVTKEEPALR